MSGNANFRHTDFISIDALVLLALVQCQGDYSQKAEVFHRVVAPEYENFIPVTDKDLKTALHFMISIATILEEMTRDLIEYNGRNFGFQIY